VCLCVFVASDQPLGLIPWSTQARGFNTVPLREPEQPVRHQFSLSQVVYAGSHTCCSCGFHNDQENPAEVIRSRTALVQYIGDAAKAGPVEVFVCWEGDYTRAAIARSERSVASLAGEDDWLQELTLTRVPRVD
jgi:hypothetical protein